MDMFAVFYSEHKMIILIEFIHLDSGKMQVLDESAWEAKNEYRPSLVTISTKH